MEFQTDQNRTKSSKDSLFLLLTVNQLLLIQIIEQKQHTRQRNNSKVETVMFAYMPNRNITACFVFIFRCSQSHFFFVSLFLSSQYWKACLCVCAYVRARVRVWMGGCTEIICPNSYCMCVEPEHLFVEVLNKKLQAQTKHLLLETVIEECWKKRTHFLFNIRRHSEGCCFFFNMRELTLYTLIKALNVHLKLTTQSHVNVKCCCAP